MIHLQREFFQAQRASEPLFNFIQRHALEGIWYWDLENPGQRWLNARCYALLGYGPDEWPDWHQLIHPDDRGAATQWNPDEFDLADQAPDVSLRFIHRHQRGVGVTYRPWLGRNRGYLFDSSARRRPLPTPPPKDS